ncbi:alpha/beta fold hydrolase [Tropicibacter naphthalenivorans]|uniref:Arylesterase n=1 Tax=Tropicibacter naphthalenivorans TaxID=441103 RepID=A0A0P1GXF7_9RHOB|nr:alpha/beta hydrolase [Tropicibacter naphthalenivorans]CUH79027.1 Arylesterase [Tropicibacter naphthalenivorans]SMD03868.1 Pimeloyl-ACP methyl ester carboxylesterase [Tropicibacter naphthalenivorans]
MTPGGWIALAGLGLAALPAAREAVRTPVGALQKTAPGRFAELSEGRTHYQWFGPESGPVVVCVHGLTTPSFVWLGLVSDLTRKGYRVLTYDLYGRGYSDAPRGQQSPGFFAEQLRALLSDQNLHEDITLIGYSMGGAIATSVAAEEHHRLSRLILVAPAGMGHTLGRMATWATEWPIVGDWAFHMAFPRAHRAAVLAERTLPSTVQNIGDQQISELRRKGFVRSVLSSLRGTLRRDMQSAHRTLAAAQLPVTAIWGRDDRTIPLRAMGTLTQWNRDVRHIVIDDAGHGLPYTHTDQITRLL